MDGRSEPGRFRAPRPPVHSFSNRWLQPSPVTTSLERASLRGSALRRPAHADASDRGTAAAVVLIGLARSRHPDSSQPETQLVELVGPRLAPTPA